ncbi:MAG: hypothetical protein AB1635_15500 [Acidobacteriota bacterium]
MSFVHLASVETADGTNPLSAIASFKAFTHQIGERCDEPPAAVGLHEAGTFRWFDGR